MGHLEGLKEYLDKAYYSSVFGQALVSGYSWNLHIHEHKVIRANIAVISSMT